MKSYELNPLSRQYHGQRLDENDLLADPLEQSRRWLQEAIDQNIDLPHAVSLATVNAQGQPSVRMVLVKEISEKGFVFFTNKESAKGQHLRVNPQAALAFYWKESNRQIRVEGVVEEVSDDESKAYFHSRPFESQIAAFVSQQSQAVANRQVLEGLFAQNLALFEKEGQTPWPQFWGGYCLRPHQVEFWQGGSHRLHDRILFTRQNEGWDRARLQP